MKKSSDNELQRATYYGQKKRHFLRLETICSTNGRILDIYGPYMAVNNDAQTIMHVLEEHEELRDLLKPNDVIILDRGFRDCVVDLKQSYQLIVRLPTCNIFELYLN